MITTEDAECNVHGSGRIADDGWRAHAGAMPLPWPHAEVQNGMRVVTA